jgi:hypothetical protein
MNTQERLITSIHFIIKQNLTAEIARVDWTKVNQQGLGEPAGSKTFIKGEWGRFTSFLPSHSLSRFKLRERGSSFSLLLRRLPCQFLEWNGRRRWRFIGIFINSAVNSRFRRASYSNHMTPNPNLFYFSCWLWIWTWFYKINGESS